MGDPTILGDWLAVRLGALGARRVYGSQSFRGMHHVAVSDPALARLLAAAEGRVLGGVGAALLDERTLHLSSAPGLEHPERLVRDGDELAQALANPDGLDVPGGVTLKLDLLYDAPAPDVVYDRRSSRRFPPGLPKSASVAVLAGPGAVRNGNAPLVRQFLDRLGFGAVVTWGAAGLLPMDSPQLLGVGGLQQEDLRLALTGIDHLVAIGVDPQETKSPLPRLPVLRLTPDALATVPRTTMKREARPSPLASELRAALAPLYSDPRAPLNPARACLEMAEMLPGDGIVVADAGLPGLWVARTFPHERPGGSIVPSIPAKGFAAAGALACALVDRPAIGVTTYPVDAETAAVVEVARRLNASIMVVAWGPDAPSMDADEFRATMERARHEGGARVIPVGVGSGDVAVLTDIAGPIVAWPALVGPPKAAKRP